MQMAPYDHMASKDISDDSQVHGAVYTSIYQAVFGRTCGFFVVAHARALYYIRKSVFYGQKYFYTYLSTLMKLMNHFPVLYYYEGYIRVYRK